MHGENYDIMVAQKRFLDALGKKAASSQMECVAVESSSSISTLKKWKTFSADVIKNQLTLSILITVNDQTISSGADLIFKLPVTLLIGLHECHAMENQLKDEHIG
ncbi:hypothetical protein BDA99DRAFT_543160 [Phascolomyces articulosus]|uniref:Uncharacterized protein n=1 Tax=Phascolomyces articulosus TaxID=60185 RepID=A0AAD5P9Q2_9FUNG|nr:hypothetical protein BDA99DRAFT_543160 [Phascolomyces articulosus]